MTALAMKNLPLSSWPHDRLSVLLKKAETERTSRADRNCLTKYHPYRKQRDFHAAGATHDERLFMAGNQLGKTLAGGMEWAMHLTGRYPDWWRGHTFNEPVKLWAAGVTGLSTRQNPQRILIGPPAQPERWGTGAIPKDCLKDTITGRGVANELDSVVVRWGGGGDTAVSKHVTFMTIDDAEHYTAEQRATIVAGYPAHEREARAKGIPVLGSGRVFPVEEENIIIPPMPVPSHWAQINGLDFGYDHPFAAVNCAWDKDADVFYVCKEYRERAQTPHTHVASVKPWGDWIPCAWPHDGLQHDKGGSCEQLKTQYESHGLEMLEEKATFEDGGYGVEAGVLEMLERMQTGRWKVFSTCGSWIGEFRLYHREGGIIVKLQDDLISASRYAMMMRRFASVKRSSWSQPPAKPGWVV